MLRLALLVLCAYSAQLNMRAVSTAVPIRVIQGSVPAVPVENEMVSFPPYTQAVHNFTKFVYPIIDVTNLSQVNLQTVLGVIDGIADLVSQGLQSVNGYNALYEEYATKIFTATLGTPAAAATRLTCVLGDVNSSVQRLLGIILRNPSVSMICERKPQLCDQSIQAIIDSAPIGSELRKEAKILLALGKATGLYESVYEKLLKTQEQSDSWKTHTFVITSRDLLKPLILSAVSVRQAMQRDICDWAKLPLSKSGPANIPLRVYS